MKLFLVRHGETEANAQHILLGRSDSRLTEKGMQQATEVAERLQDKGIKAIFHSPLGRATTTARIINDVLRVPIFSEPLLLEMSYGDWDGVAKEQLQENYPELWAQKEKDKYNFVHPGAHEGIHGMSYKDLFAAIGQFVEKIKGLEYDTVLAVSHLGVLRNAKKYFAHLSDKETTAFNPSNDDISVYDID